MLADFKIYDGEEELFKLVFLRLIVPPFSPSVFKQEMQLHACISVS